MIAAQSAHPAKDQLLAFGQGKLADDESSRIEQHLEICRECCETLLDLKDDTFTGLVRHAKQIAVADAPGTGDRPVVSPPETDHATDGHVAGPGSQAATLLAQSAETICDYELPAELRDHPRYRIVELIGQGGMGAVYRAEHRLMNRAVAIKLINAQLVQHPQAVERFRREVQAAAKLSHPNIVAAYDAEQAGNAHFLVMEFVDGTDLATVVEQRGPMPVAEACECIRQAAAGLQHAHEKGMVHRDIKPHNLMLATGGQVRILDFGLAGFATEAALESSPLAPREESGLATDADSTNLLSQSNPTAPRDPLTSRGARGLRSAEHLTAIGSVMGTPDYMAPEQAADAHSADIRADIYSLGCTLHFLLTGRPPFEADNAVAKIMAHAEQLPPDLTAIRPDVPRELSTIVARMMAKNPAERFQMPAEVAAALAPFCRLGVAPPRKRTLRKILAAAAAILLAGVIYITTDKGRVEIRSERDDVEFVILKGGTEIKAIDLQTGTQVTWLPSGEYNVVLRDGNDYINLEKSGFKLSRWGKEIVTVKREPAAVEAAELARVTAAKTDHELLQGQWSLVSMQVGQRKFDQKELAGQATIELTFVGDNFNLKRIALAGDRVPAGTVMRPAAMDGQFFLDTAKNPKRITVMVPKDNLNSLLGIYRLDGDKLTLCCIENPDSNEYPTVFATKSGSRAVLYEFQREVSAGLPSGVVDQMLLQGLWIAVEGHAGGQPIPAEQLPKFSIKIDQDQITITPPGPQSQVRHGTFKNNATTTLKRLDIVVGDKKEPMAGIYEVDQKRLKLSLVEGDAARPTDFSPSDRAGHITGVFERAPYTGTSEYVEFRPAGLNGSFEITQYGLPVNWHMSTPKREQGSDFDIMMDTTDFKEGKQSLKFVVRKCDEKRGPGFFKEFAPNQNPPAAFETKPGETYRISFWAKNAGSEFVFKARGVSSFKGDEGVVIRSKETINEWRRFECTYTIPPKMWLRIHLNVVQPGTFWIDDIRIVKVDEKVPVPPEAEPGGAAAVMPDEQRLQGKWVAVSGQARKQPIPAEQLAMLSITFDGEQVTFDQPGVPAGSQRGTIEINANSNPKRINFVAPDPTKETLPGIYEFDGERLKLAVIDEDYARPTNFDPDDRPDHMTLVLERAPLTGPALGQVEWEVLNAAQEWLAVMNEGKFGQLFDLCSSWAKRFATREQTSQSHQKIRDSLGKAVHRTLYRVQPFVETPGLPSGRYMAVQYKSRFERQQEIWETLAFHVDTDGKWRLVTYVWTLEPPPLPEPKNDHDDPATKQKRQAALSAAQDWLKLVDAGNYGESWESSAKVNKDGINRDAMDLAYQGLFQPLGPIKSRELKTNEFKTQLPRAPVGEYVVIQFSTQFTNGRVTETVVLTREADNQWRVSGYFHSPRTITPNPTSGSAVDGDQTPKR
jgi:uncharacterized protein (TIGR03067 family)